MLLPLRLPLRFVGRGAVRALPFDPPALPTPAPPSAPLSFMPSITAASMSSSLG